MKKLFAVVAVAALALTSVVPLAQAAAPSTHKTSHQVHKRGHSNIHKVAQKKTKSKSTKKRVSNTHKVGGAPKA
jgi:hypothetical protein